ncbi:MAG: hypothetical protein ACP5GZ_01750 [Vulcanisaeta sp.]
MKNFIIDNRDILIMPEEVYTKDEYGEINHDINDVSNGVIEVKEEN